MPTLLELQEARAAAIGKARAIIDLADKEKRSVTADENAEVDKWFADSDKLDEQINTLQRREELARREGAIKNLDKRKTDPERSRYDRGESRDVSAAMRSWFKRSKDSPTRDELENAHRCGIDLTNTQTTIHLAKRALGKGDAGYGAAATQWTEIYNQFEKELKYYGPMMQLATMRETVSGQDLPIPILDDTGNMAAIVAENGAVNAQDPSGGSLILKSFKYTSKELALSLEFLQDTATDIESEIAPMLAERFGRKWNRDMTVGAGTTEPYGIATRATAASVSGTAVVAGGTAAAPTFANADVLFDLVDSVDEAYANQNGSGFMMHKYTRTKLRKLKDSQGRYLWEPSLQAGSPETFDGKPIYLNPDMPVAGVTGTAVPLILFGLFSDYILRRVTAIELYRLDQLRILNGQISWVAFARADGNLKRVNAVKKLMSTAT